MRPQTSPNHASWGGLWSIIQPFWVVFTASDSYIAFSIVYVPETSRDWRRMGIARGLVEFCMQQPWIEHVMVLAMGLDWHWDLEGTGLDFTGYRAVLRWIFEAVGFREMHTSEPNVAMHASNLLLVRVGSNVPDARLTAFKEALFIPPWQRSVVPPPA